MIKPLLIHKKSEIIDEANKRNLEWLEDPSNQDTAFARRNFIRHSLLPQALQINPGLFGMVRKRIIKKTLNS
jgi:tRNA(Ile)-lysidine synthase